jgi:hypothetical protein
MATGGGGSSASAAGTRSVPVVTVVDSNEASGSGGGDVKREAHAIAPPSTKSGEPVIVTKPIYAPHIA